MRDFYDRKLTGSVTEHKVIEVAESNPELFMPEGEVCVPRVLFYLGLDVRSSMYDNNYSVEDDFLIRSTKFPTKAYKTRVYSGDVRKATKIDENGNPVPDKDKIHPMSQVYLAVNVLQADNIERFVSEKDMIDVSTIGNKKSRGTADE